jgi:glucuronoarabinoxylan endo-1,4-beta-xylanase
MKKYLFFCLIIFLSNLVNAQSLNTTAGDITVKAKETHQTMIGFGASIAWADDQLASHPKRNEIYNLIMNDLGLGILRFRNTFRFGSVSNGANISSIVSSVNKIAGSKPVIFISSWSPPADLKSNNNTANGGTLKKDSTGRYLYSDFAKYWTDAITAYSNLGVVPDYISIQNEPDFTASYESCYFSTNESYSNAGYNKALDSVSAAIRRTGLHSKIIGPEPLGIGYSDFQNYVKMLHSNNLDGYAYHLYTGESDNVNDNHNPDLFNGNLRAIAGNYPGKPIWVTEYDRGDWFNTGWLINNCIVNGNVSAYLWWELVWGSGGKPLIEMQSTSYTISKFYWTIKHFSKFISAGWERVTAESDSDNIKTSAFINPEGNKLTVVVINTGSQTQTKNLNIQDFKPDNGIVFRTTDNLNYALIDSSFNNIKPLDYPARSITTISFSGSSITSVQNHELTPFHFSVSQNFPNPFNPETTIEFTLSEKSDVRIILINVLGQVVKEIASGNYIAGQHQLKLDGSGLSSGVYFYRFETGNYSITKKLVLLK